MGNTQYAVLGLGRFGESVVRFLSENGKDVLACDKDIETVQRLANVATHVVRADVNDEATLDALGLNNFDYLIIALASDMEATIMATMFAKEAGVKKIIVKAKNKTHEALLKKIGADRVVLPEKEMGIRVAQGLVNKNILEHINLSDKHAMAEISPIRDWVGKSLLEAEIRNKYKLNVILIKREKKILVSPGANEIIEENDILIVVGTHVDINTVGEKYDAEKNNK